ncbi:hypothetical protein KP806_04455 [Paenibacillus sp. N4]|uniref:stalk domain-containing protein n=1 Tax=Paenibacillus vietnamensis TaxID=2590547 RepID=UPI001CD0F436|nr:stalk domain-containing protein [Paenibacillus vietnamensis]MCA0754288.1 hypothetical protein [Paenibacillus vietnamensis]
MSRRTIRKSSLAIIALAVTASVWNGTPSAHAQLSSGSAGRSDSGTVSVRPVSVSFQNLQISLPRPPKLINGTMMVPGRALLEGLGCELEWDAADRKLSVLLHSKRVMTFWANRHEAEAHGEMIGNLSAAPYIDDLGLWVPLRLAAEASGLRVSWEASLRLAIVSDPHALPVIRVAAKADNGMTEPPTQLLSAMRERMNADIRLNLYAPENYRDRINIMIAAGEMQDLMLLEDPYPYPDDLLESIALDLTDELKQFPRLSRLAQNESGGRTVSGKSIGIARPGDPHDAPFPAIRQDWLDRLGLVKPSTMEELYEALKLFTTHDPDGNGKYDTVGLTGYLNGDGLGTLSWVEHAFTGFPARFSVKDGQITDHAVSPEEEKALQWLARAYADGLIDKEFPVISKEQADSRLSGNQAGLSAISLSQAAALTSDSSIWSPLPGIKADAGSTAIAPWNTRGNGMYIVTVMTKTDRKAILEWLDRGYEMTENGEWAKVDGLENRDHSAISHLFGQTDVLAGGDSLDQLPGSVRKDYETAVNEWRKTTYEGQVLQQAGGLWRSGEYAEMNRKLEQFKIKVIVGAASISEWKAFAAEMTDSEEYRKMMKGLQELL